MPVKPYHDLSVRQKLKIKTRNRHRRRFFDRVPIREYVCPSCGSGYADSGTDIWEVHHRDGDALNGHMVNLVALCHRCHKHAHSSVRTKAELDRWKSSIEDLGADRTPSVSKQAKLSDYTQEADA